jgi:hypothetical protein
MKATATIGTIPVDDAWPAAERRRPEDVRKPPPPWPRAWPLLDPAIRGLLCGVARVVRRLHPEADVLLELPSMVRRAVRASWLRADAMGVSDAERERERLDEFYQPMSDDRRGFRDLDDLISSGTAEVYRLVEDTCWKLYGPEAGR